MQQSQTNTELSHTSTTAKESTPEHSSKPLATNERWEKTDFWIRGSEETGYFATLGQYRVTDVYDDFEEAQRELKWPTAQTIFNINAVFANAIEDNTK